MMNFRCLVVIVVLVCLFWQDVGAGVETHDKVDADDDLSPIAIEDLLMGDQTPKEAMSKYDKETHLLKSEMDIEYSKDELIKTQNRDKRSAGFYARHRRRWTNKVVNYEIQPNHFSDKHKLGIKDALDEMSHFICVKFVETNQKRNRVLFKSTSGCFSKIGMSGGVQTLGLSAACRDTKRAILHEMSHALGVAHEQSRPDRDNYITVLFANVQSANKFNFNKKTWTEIMRLQIPYDYRSIMHYSPRSFSSNGQKTILTKDHYFQDKIGMYKGLSFGDIKTLNLMYNCHQETPNCNLKHSDCPGQGFVGKNCACWCPGNPVQYCSEQNRKNKASLNYVSKLICKNNHPSCDNWARSGKCQKSAIFMKNTCPVACNMCGNRPICKDKTNGCQMFVRQGHCKRQVMRMEQVCQASCNLC